MVRLYSGPLSPARSHIREKNRDPSNKTEEFFWNLFRVQHLRRKRPVLVQGSVDQSLRSALLVLASSLTRYRIRFPRLPRRRWW